MCYKCEHGLESVNEAGKSMYGNSADSQHGYTYTQTGEMCVICSYSVSECTCQGGNESVIRDGDLSSQYTDKHVDTPVMKHLCCATHVLVCNHCNGTSDHGDANSVTCTSTGNEMQTCPNPHFANIHAVSDNTHNVPDPPQTYKISDSLDFRVQI